MEKLITPEVLIPIFLNIVLATATVLYLLETRTSRKAIVKQFEISQRQHFVTTTPFIYAGSLKRNNDSEKLTISIVNPGEKLARDVSCIIYESNKKTFRYPTTTKVVVKPNETTTLSIDSAPYTAGEVITRLKKYYGTGSGLDTHLITTPATSYTLLIFTDIEGSIYSVKSLFSWTDDDKFSRQRSRFQKLSDPRSS